MNYKRYFFVFQRNWVTMTLDDIHQVTFQNSGSSPTKLWNWSPALQNFTKV